MSIINCSRNSKSLRPTFLKFENQDFFQKTSQSFFFGFLAFIDTSNSLLAMFSLNYALFIFYSRSNSLHSTVRDSRLKAMTGRGPDVMGLLHRSFSSSGEEDELRSTTEISSLGDEFFDDSDYSIHSDSGESPVVQ